MEVRIRRPVYCLSKHRNRYSKVKKLNVPCAAVEVYREWRYMFTTLLTMAFDGSKFVVLRQVALNMEKDPTVHYRIRRSVF